MALLHDEVVDGVRTIWVDSGRPTLMATLFFRAGAADETLATSGWLHLLEHLALHGRERGSLHVNGSVGPLTTTFMFHGPVQPVAEALCDLTRWLAAPDFRELSRERRVLAAEEATRAGGGPAGRAFGMRYGACGPGLLSTGTPGLGRAGAEALTELAHRAFVTGNAALALDGPPPAALALALPPGDRLPVSPAVPVERPRAAYVEPAGLVVSGVLPRSTTNTLVASVVEDALRRQLRDRDGAAYAPYSLYEGVDADHALVVAGSDVSPATGPTLLGNVLHLVDGLARTGPDPTALSDIIDKTTQAYTDPYNVGGLAYRAAMLTLQDIEPQQLDELVAEQESVTPESLRPGLVAFRDSLIVGAPAPTKADESLRVIEQPRTSGRTRGARSANWPADRSRLSVGEDAVVVGNGEAVLRYPLSEVAGYLTWSNGARHLVLQDGWGLTLLPEAWSGGERHVGYLDLLVRRELHLPQPDETAPTADPRAGSFRRWAIALLGLGWLGWLVWALFIAVIAYVAAATGHPRLIGPLLVGAFVTVVVRATRDRA